MVQPGHRPLAAALGRSERGTGRRSNWVRVVLPAPDLTPAREASDVLLDGPAALDPDGGLESGVRAVDLALAGLARTGSVTTTGSTDLVLVDARRPATGMLVLAGGLLGRAAAGTSSDRHHAIADADAGAALRDGR